MIVLPQQSKPTAQTAQTSTQRSQQKQQQKQFMLQMPNRPTPTSSTLQTPQFQTCPLKKSKLQEPGVVTPRSFSSSITSSNRTSPSKIPLLQVGKRVKRRPFYSDTFLQIKKKVLK